MASELHEGSTDNHAVRRYTLTITVAIPPPHRALTVTVRRVPPLSKLEWPYR